MAKEIRAKFSRGVIEPLDNVDLEEGEEVKPTFPIWLKSCLSNSSMVFQPLSNYGPFLRVLSYNNSMICHFAVRCRRHHGGT